MKNKADNKKRNFLTHSEIESLLKAANTGPHAARNYCLTLLCFIHGFRASEICRLRISDIDLKAKCIYIHRLKKGFSTTHPLLNKEVQALKNWLSIRTSYPHAESEWVFLSRKGNPLSRQQFYHIISTSGGNAGLSLEIHPHMLRHSCGFALANLNLLADDACVPLTSMIHDATAHLDVGQQRLNLTIPQAFMSNRARGYIPPELWDPGINAGLLNYNFSGNSVQNRIGGNSHYAYLNLQSGLNIGAWRLRDNTTWSYNSSDSSSGSKNKWQHINTWLERDIIPLRSRLTLGDGYT